MTPAERVAAARRELSLARAELQEVLRRDRTRRRGAAMRQLHEIDRMLRPDDPWRSQAGQDRVVDRLLGCKSGGVFVDVGGYDGVTGSNTLFFEETRGWTGVLVEPVPAMLDRARVRRRCPCLGVAVATREGEAEFIEVTRGYTQMSGLAGTYDPALLERVRSDPRHREDVRRVPTRTLSSILTGEGVPDPDYLSLDIEGGEVAVLEEFPFEKHRITAWSIENNTADPRIPEIMRANGYDLVEFCGPDDIYLKSGV
ncbi:FkbM family methyltransferase [Histidinibacterium lentulum]|uniref:FkbM family methyltransferase n=1 Tax=Histidinibacterium lentulum TaxID=2480588 RepID=A0A3N2R7C7_9RHOB|nr:FkbM family methyltransferase [Histidinibacterium lentulum]ROU03226.1 FkbM family methyltransferase [Histidinibacterium lentulum]